MKSMKKFLALALVLALCFAMAIPAMAANEMHSITIPDTMPGHVLKVYQIFTGDIGAPEAGGANVLANVKYGDAFANTEEEKVTQANLDDWLKRLDEGYTGEDKLTADAFAKLLMNVENGWSLTNNDRVMTEVKTGDETTGYKIEGLAPGYYLIVDDSTDDPISGNKGDNYSAYIVKLLDQDLELQPKKETSEIDKTIADAPTADDLTLKIGDKSYSIGDDVPFVVTAKIPVTQLEYFALKDAPTFKVTFRDAMSPSLTLKKDTFQVSIRKSEAVAGQILDIDSYSTVVGEDAIYENAKEGYQKFNVTIDNLFDFITTAKEDWPATDGFVYVDLSYKATLNENAYVLGGGSDLAENMNNAYLTTSNDPNSDTEGDGTSTPEVPVPVYTFTLDGTKIAGEKNDNGENVPLAGATFKLYKAKDVTAEVGQEVKAEKDGDAIKFLKVTGENKTRYIKYTGDTAVGSEATVEIGETSITGIVVDSITTGEDGKFVFEGLGAGDYILEETVPPTGYNKCDDILIQLREKVEYEDAEKEIVKSVTGEIIAKLPIGSTYEDGENNPSTSTQFEVVNNKGTLLPSTGGIGTTIFYAVGAALVVGAGILLFVKKRMGSKG